MTAPRAAPPCALGLGGAEDRTALALLDHPNRIGDHTMTARAAKFAAIYALMRASADVGDHWVQSDQCAHQGCHRQHIPLLLGRSTRT